MTKTEQIFKLTAPYNNQYQTDRLRWLYVCSAGLLRSPTGATVAIKNNINARSCGSSDRALIPLSSNLIHWAQRIIFVNEENYLAAEDTFKLYLDVSEILKSKSCVLDIEDDFDYMDPKLVRIFKQDIEKMVLQSTTC